MEDKSLVQRLTCCGRIESMVSAEGGSTWGILGWHGRQAHTGFQGLGVRVEGLGFRV